VPLSRNLGNLTSWIPLGHSRPVTGLLYLYLFQNCGPGNSVGIVTEYGLDGTGIESRWGRDFPPVQTGPGAYPASCKMGTGSFPGLKCGRGRAADHSSPSSAAVMEQYSYTSTHTLGHTGPVTGSLYLFQNSDV
jgi:hypothetical protein